MAVACTQLFRLVPFRVRLAPRALLMVCAWLISSAANYRRYDEAVLPFSSSRKGLVRKQISLALRDEGPHDEDDIGDAVDALGQLMICGVVELTTPRALHHFLEITDLTRTQYRHWACRLGVPAGDLVLFDIARTFKLEPMEDLRTYSRRNISKVYRKLDDAAAMALTADIAQLPEWVPIPPDAPVTLGIILPPALVVPVARGHSHCLLLPSPISSGPFGAPRWCARGMRACPSPFPLPTSARDAGLLPLNKRLCCGTFRQKALANIKLEAFCWRGFSARTYHSITAS